MCVQADMGIISEDGREKVSKGRLGPGWLDILYHTTAVLASIKSFLAVKYLCSSPMTLGCSCSHLAVLLTLY